MLLDNLQQQNAFGDENIAYQHTTILREDEKKPTRCWQIKICCKPATESSAEKKNPLPQKVLPPTVYIMNQMQLDPKIYSAFHGSVKCNL